jgi:hypothetical protein
VSFSSYADVAAALKRESDLWGPTQNKEGFEAAHAHANAARQWWSNQQQSSSVQDSPISSPPPPPPTPPDPWIKTSSYVAPTGVKQADPDIVLFNDTAVSPELLLQLQYEDVAGMELINISRSDTIDGQRVSYSPIARLSQLRRKYNPNNIISLPATSADPFSRFGIDLILRGIKEPYFDERGNLVIEIEDILEDEIIEAEVDTSGTINLVDNS